MERNTDRIENAIRHIETAADVDPWARDIAVAAMKDQIFRPQTGMLIIENDSIDIDTVDMVAITHKGRRFARVYMGQGERISDPVYVTEDGKENHCDECLWATRSGGCSQWDCEFIDKTEAFEAWREKHG